MGRKLGQLLYFFLGGAGSPSITKRGLVEVYLILSGILIHPNVWPQYTNVTDIELCVPYFQRVKAALFRPAF